LSLSEYFRILRRWGWLLVLATVLTAGAAYVFSKVQTPIFRSTVVVNLQTRVDLGTTESAKNLLRSYVTVINTETYAQKVIDELQLDRTAGDLLGNVTIASDESRFVIQIDVRDPSPDVANNIALAWANQLVAWRDQQNAQQQQPDKVTAVIVDLPKPSLYRPITKINVLAGAILGLLVGGIIVFVVEYIDSGIIRSSDDLDRLNLAVLGAIPAEAALSGRGVGRGLGHGAQAS
jgi:capsular polysaccharide biosynthesis protein